MGSELIKSRDDFFRVLSEAQGQIGDRIRKNPKFDIWLNLEMQLDAVWRWTADGRTPTEDERASIDIGLIAVRELEPASTDEEQAFVTNLHELNYYFENWPEDPDVPAESPEL